MKNYRKINVPFSLKLKKNSLQDLLFLCNFYNHLSFHPSMHTLSFRDLHLSYNSRNVFFDFDINFQLLFKVRKLQKNRRDSNSRTPALGIAPQTAGPLQCPTICFIHLQNSSSWQLDIRNIINSKLVIYNSAVHFNIFNAESILYVRYILRSNWSSNHFCSFQQGPVLSSLLHP